MRKKLYRSSEDRVIAGVCAGIGEYLNIDPIIPRILFLLAVITEGFGIMVYIILWIVMPEEKSTGKDAEEVVKENIKDIEKNVKEKTRGIKKEVTSDTKEK